jgi:outer membrane protein assembly factor BamB
VEHSLVVPIARGANRGIVCLVTPDTGQKAASAHWKFPAALGVWQSPAVVGERVLFVTGEPVSEGRSLYCVDRTSGLLHWQHPIEAEATGVLTAHPRGVIVQVADRLLSHFDLSGDQLWTQDVGRIAHSPAVSGLLLAMCSDLQDELIVLDLPTGRPLCRRPLGARATTSPVVRGDRVYVGTERGLACVALTEAVPAALQRPAWQRGAAAVASELVVLRGHLAYVNQENELLFVSMDTGEVVRRATDALAGITPVLSRDTLLFAGSTGLCLWRPGDEDHEPELWLDDPVAAEWMAPMVLHDACVYFGGKSGLMKVVAAP